MRAKKSSLNIPTNTPRKALSDSPARQDLSLFECGLITAAGLAFSISPQNCSRRPVGGALRVMNATFASALHPTDLSIERGKTTVLIGPSGCGKSTLLRVIIGLIPPDSGTIDFDASQITPVNIEMLRRRIGYVIQEGGLFPHLTARANILLMARHLGKSDEEMHV